MPAPNLIISDLEVGSQTLAPGALLSRSIAAGSSFTITIDIKNIGDRSASSSTAAVFLRDVSGNEVRMDTNSTNSLSAGRTDPNEELTVTVPANYAPGTYMVIVRADYRDRVSNESNEADNFRIFLINVTGGPPDSVREGTDTRDSLTEGRWRSDAIEAEPIAGDGVVSDRVGGFIDKDWYEVTLSANRTYSFEAESVSLSTGQVFIRLYNSAGNRVSTATEAEGASPRFSYSTAGQSGSQTFYVAVGAGDTNGADFRTATGDYRVRFNDEGALSTSPSNFTINPMTLTVDESVGTAVFTITRTNTSGSETVWVSTVRSEGFANNGDYAGLDTIPFTFRAGEDTIPVSIRIIDDLAAEPTERFAVWVQRNQNDPYGVYVNRAILTIQDNDTTSESTTFTLSSDVSSVVEDNVRVNFIATRSGDDLSETTIYFTTLYGTASSAGRDYVGARALPLTFREGSETATFHIEIKEDSVDEQDETFEVMLGLSPNSGRADAVAIRQITIVDDDTSVVEAPVFTTNGTTRGAVSVPNHRASVYFAQDSISLTSSTPQNVVAVNSGSLATTNAQVMANSAQSTSVSFAGPGATGSGVFVITKPIVEVSLDFASDVLAADVFKILKSGLDIGSLANAFRAFFITLEGASNPLFRTYQADEVFMYTHQALSKKLGAFSVMVDVAERARNIVAAGDNWQSRFFAEFIDLFAGATAQVFGGLVGGLLAGVTSSGFLSFAGITGGKLLGGLVYDYYLKDHMIRQAEAMWNARFPRDDFGQDALALESAESSAAFDVSDRAIDYEFYAQTYPAAVEAVESGVASNLIAYFIKWGIAAGHIANAEARPLNPAEVGIDIAAFDPMSFGTPAVFSSRPGILAGDWLSSNEMALAVLVNAFRGASGTLNVDDELTALANRIARDWMENNPEAAMVVQDGGDPTSWLGTASDGQDFRQAFGSVNWSDLVLDDGLRVAGVISGADTAAQAFSLFSATAAGAAFLADPTSRGIGVAEYAGLWVIVTSTATLQNDALVDDRLAIAHQFASDAADVVFAGTGPGNAYLGDDRDTFFGGVFNDTVRGGGGADQLFGGRGHDRLHGGTGDDTMLGGAGNDIYFVDSAGDQVYETTSVTATTDAGGLDTVHSEIDFNLLAHRGVQFVENLVLEGTGNLQGIGNALANSLTGNSGHNVLRGAAGNDTLWGGDGNDTLDGGEGRDRLDGGAGSNVLRGGAGDDRYVIRSAEDRIVDEIGFSQGGGIDTVESWVSFTLPTNVEILRLQGEADLAGTGNAAPGALVGNVGRNQLDGAGGNDVLNGKSGDDRLIGGLGADSLVGEAGRDVFVIRSVAESRPGQGNRDFINGFARGQDLIDLSGIDANALTAQDDAFAFIGSAAFSGVAGQLRYFSFGGGNFCIVEGDTNGDRVADMQIFVNQRSSMVQEDFVL